MANHKSLSDYTRKAFERGVQNLKAGVAAGTISAADAVLVYERFHAAYQLRKDQKAFRAFMASRGIKLAQVA